MRQKLVLASVIVILTTSVSMLMPAFAISWSEHEKRLTTHVGFDGLPSITVTSDGKIWAVWTRCVEYQDFNLYYKNSSDAGASWSDETALTTDPSVDASPSICQVANGTVWVVWSSDRTGDWDLYYKTSFDGGWSWSNDTRLTDDPDFDKLPSITQTDDGNVWVVWSSDRFGDDDIFYNVYNGSSWSGDMRLPTSTDLDTDPSVLQTFDHRIWIFWQSRAPTATSATDDIYYKYSLDDGATWSESIQFTIDINDDWWTCTAQSSDRTMWVIWSSDRPDGTDWDVYCRTSIVGDVNEDGRVDIRDLVMIAMVCWSGEGDPGYDPDLDLNGDGWIDIRDLSIIGRNYGKTDS